MIYKELDERIRLSNLYGTIGNINLNMDKFEDAIKYYNLAKQIFLSEDKIKLSLVEFKWCSKSCALGL